MMNMLSNDNGKCWNTIGISGDKTCRDLNETVHCRNCKTYSRKGRALLHKKPPEEYKHLWTSYIASEKKKQRPGNIISVFIFKIGEKRLSVKTGFIKSVVEGGMIHYVPHRSNDIFIGLTNIEGDLLPCISMADLLELNHQGNCSHKEDFNSRQMIVLNNHGESWVFQADEVEGIFHLDQEKLEDVPITPAKAFTRFSLGLFEKRGTKVTLLDEKKVFEMMQRNIS